MTFYLFGSHDEKLRLKSFSSSTNGTKGTIRITLETSSMFELGCALEELRNVQKGQREKPKPQPKPKAAKQKVLALPPPPLALPKPE
ncbi:hypothetical protein GCM10007291_22390 [Gemmobacter nanjingensis]|uniref:Uncharacterized protein n=1 Tax=Gemmobacter nanjingensis TaxID=488454 RepID=A0ABQ3FG65_9RHOB|nr:hypothetical protein [Gemmobacter nanjingensis]GHC22453.1 hypothetical protein GCM10007291_22390 [Gemmobacter nanjingensis]